jgi:cell division protein FtsL
VVLVLVALFSAWQHFELLRHGYRVEQMQMELGEEEEIGRHLLLELETLRSPKRIEELAIEQLHLAAPGPGETVILERAVAPARPATTIVASR